MNCTKNNNASIQQQKNNNASIQQQKNNQKNPVLELTNQYWCSTSKGKTDNDWNKHQDLWSMLEGKWQFELEWICCDLWIQSVRTHLQSNLRSCMPSQNTLQKFEISPLSLHLFHHSPICASTMLSTMTSEKHLKQSVLTSCEITSWTFVSVVRLGAYLKTVGWFQLITLSRTSYW